MKNILNLRNKKISEMTIEELQMLLAEEELNLFCLSVDEKDGREVHVSEYEETHESIEQIKEALAEKLMFQFQNGGIDFELPKALWGLNSWCRCEAPYVDFCGGFGVDDADYIPEMIHMNLSIDCRGCLCGLNNDSGMELSMGDVVTPENVVEVYLRYRNMTLDSLIAEVEAKAK